MNHKHPFRRRKFSEVYETPPCATDILADILDISPDKARAALVSLVSAGFFFGPREPTNSMLIAYMDAVYPGPSTPWAITQAIGKARRRWKAMSEAGTKVALSNVNSERGGTVDAADLKSAGLGHAGSIPAARTN